MRYSACQITDGIVFDKCSFRFKMKLLIQSSGCRICIICSKNNRQLLVFAKSVNSFPIKVIPIDAANVQ